MMELSKRQTCPWLNQFRDQVAAKVGDHQPPRTAEGGTKEGTAAAGISLARTPRPRSRAPPAPGRRRRIPGKGTLCSACCPRWSSPGPRRPRAARRDEGVLDHEPTLYCDAHLYRLEDSRASDVGMVQPERRHGLEDPRRAEASSCTAHARASLFVILRVPFEGPRPPPEHRTNPPEVELYGTPGDDAVPVTLFHLPEWVLITA